MLRLLRLLSWSDNAEAQQTLPRLICGPFADIVHWFQTRSDEPWRTPRWVWVPPPALQADPVARAAAWRLAMLYHYIDNHSIVRACMPDDEPVLPLLLVLVDSMHPLIRHLETTGEVLDQSSLVRRRLLPELCRDRVIDATCVRSFLACFVPLLFTGPANSEFFIVTDTLCRSLGLHEPTEADYTAIKLLYGLFRRLFFRKSGIRTFLASLHTGLSSQTPEWLSPVLVTMIKCVLLGNYPTAQQCMRWDDRHLVYSWTWQDILVYFRAAAQDPRKTDRDPDTRVAMTCLVQLFGIFFDAQSYSASHVRRFVDGWDAFQRANDTLLQVILRVFPAPPDHQSVQASYAKLPVLTLLYQDSIYTLATFNKESIKHVWDDVYQLDLDWQHVDRLNGPFFQYMCKLTPADTAILPRLQRAFDVWGTVPAVEAVLADMSAKGAAKVANFCAWVAHRRIFKITGVNHRLALKQHLRLMEIDPGQRATDLNTVPHCRKCNMVRTKPIGLYMPSSYVTVQLRVHWKQLLCMECRSPDLEIVNVMGATVRCLLSPKNKPGAQTLTVCTSCNHITVLAPDRFLDEGPVCNECYISTLAIVSTAPQTPTRCLNGCNLSNRHQTHPKNFFVSNPVRVVAICPTCLPWDLAFCANTTRVFDEAELVAATRRKREQVAAVQAYTTTNKHAKRPKLP